MAQNIMFQTEPASDLGLVGQPKLDLDPSQPSFSIPGHSLCLPGLAQSPLGSCLAEGGKENR
jgi:hypothetical protein